MDPTIKDTIAKDCSSDTNSDSSQEITEAKLPSVSEYVNQFKTAYEQVCKQDKPRAKAAYEEIFDIANQTDDMTEAQIILEKKRLLWKIMRDSALDDLLLTLKKMDPLHKATTAKLLGQINTYYNVDCPEELTYQTDIQDVLDIGVITDYTSKMHLVSAVATLLMEYLDTKDVIYAWKNENLVKHALKDLSNKRKQLKSILTYMDKSMQMSFDDLLNDEGLKIWLLNPRSIDEYGKGKQIINNNYYSIFKDIVDKEILSNISFTQCLLRDYQ